MIVSLLAKKAALSPKLVNSLIRSIADIAREAAKDAMGLQWVRLSFMALINLLQVLFTFTITMSLLLISVLIPSVPVLSSIPMCAYFHVNQLFGILCN